LISSTRIPFINLCIQGKKSRKRISLAMIDNDKEVPEIQKVTPEDEKEAIKREKADNLFWR